MHFSLNLKSCESEGRGETPLSMFVATLKVGSDD